ncbi:MAG TPA: hypothetical protein VLV86_09350 [Vicinamibacterales bacterium]|nr:hypothetical protein [Vicinamibacterales bacterium]
MIRTELSLRLPNNAGALGGVCRALADERVRVLAMSLGDGGQLRMVLDNHVHGAAILRYRRHTVVERDVLVVDAASSVAALQLIADADINLNYAYGSASNTVLGVDDALRASAATGI